MFSLVCLSILPVIYLHYSVERRTIITIIQEREINITKLQHAIITNSLFEIISDLLFLSKQNELFMLESNQDARPLIQREYLIMVKSKLIYDQIRFIDMSGTEQVRINFNNGKPAAVPSALLQEKQQRYYFKQAIGLQRGEVYLSLLDLNMEHGKIETPAKPMLRFATPCFDRQGNKLGIVVINYLAENLLLRLKAIGTNQLSHSFLLDPNGYWLLGPDENVEWGFMYEDRKDKTFGNMYPIAWNALKEQDSGQIETDNGLFTFARFHAHNSMAHSFFAQQKTATTFNDLFKIVHDKGNRDYYWILVSFIPAKAFTVATTHDLHRNLRWAGSGLLVLFGVGLWFLAHSIICKRMFQEKMAHMAQYDSLTGLPNRALFFDRLQLAMLQARRDKGKFGLLYIDLNKFKLVNDSMGHQIGDELLEQVARILQQTVRKSDSVARMGGDEFAIVLNQIISADDLKEVGKKITTALDAPLPVSSGTVHIGASVGGAVFPDHADNAKDLIKAADESMYTSKQTHEPVCIFHNCDL